MEDFQNNIRANIIYEEQKYKRFPHEVVCGIDPEAIGKYRFLANS